MTVVQFNTVVHSLATYNDKVGHEQIVLKGIDSTEGVLGSRVLGDALR